MTRELPRLCVLTPQQKTEMTAIAKWILIHASNINHPLHAEGWAYLFVTEIGYDPTQKIQRKIDEKWITIPAPATLT